VRFGEMTGLIYNILRKSRLLSFDNLVILEQSLTICSSAASTHQQTAPVLSGKFSMVKSRYLENLNRCWYTECEKSIQRCNTVSLEPIIESMFVGLGLKL
jgi:hypothetical protein